MVNKIFTNNRMNQKIIFHIISGDLWAGAEVQVYQTLRALKNNPNIMPVCILFNDGMLASKLRQKKIKTLILDEKKNNSLEILIQLVKICRKLKPDIIHVHHIKEHFLGIFASLSTCHKVPLIRTIHGKSKVPDHVSGFQRIRSEIVVCLDKILNRFFATRIIAVSREIKEELTKSIDKNKVIHISNAIHIDSQISVDDDIQISRESFDIKEEFWIGTAARLVEPKNLELLIEAGRLLQQKDLNFKISIFGEGPLLKKLKLKIDWISS